MTNMKTLAFAAAALSVFSIGAAQAQFVGQSQPVTTVKQVLDNGRDDQMVVLEGNLINQVRNDKYTLRDATGTIVVELMTASLPASASTATQRCALKAKSTRKS